MGQQRQGTKSSNRTAAVCWGLLVGLIVPAIAQAAPRAVLIEEFTSFGCLACNDAGPALDMLLDT